MEKYFVVTETDLSGELEPPTHDRDMACDR